MANALYKYGLPILGATLGSFIPGVTPRVGSAIGGGVGAAAGQKLAGEDWNKALKAGAVGAGAGYLAGPTLKSGVEGVGNYFGIGGTTPSPIPTVPTPEGSPWYSGMTDKIPSFLKDYGLTLGLGYLGAKSQADMMGGINTANQQSYQDYLSAINPPEPVKEARLAQQETKILGSAPLARRRLSNEMAARGIRGEGTAAPMAAQERSIQDALNSAYYGIYGQYNVPGEPGPPNYAPSTANLMGANASDIATLLMLNKLYGKS